jgi:hypothetical protein
MAKDISTKALEFCAKAKDDGASWTQAYDLTEAKFGERPTYSQAWLFWAGTKLSDGERIPATGEAIAEARATGDSWGRIAVRAQVPESRVRKLYAEHTNLRSEGQRIGKGGRYLRDEDGYYQEEARFVGHAFAADAPIPSPEELTGVQALLDTRSMKDLRAEAKSLGLKVEPKATKVQVARMVARAFTQQA